ncbi:hypothetical protein SDC9_199905 [bioreactor metagenome]|uniref:Uncharacterized protein n=1 Tax=bioreactor metagenome TaxID=1076179 RepID=A0A645IPB9_9ZZZZ
MKMFFFSFGILLSKYENTDLTVNLIRSCMANIISPTIGPNHNWNFTGHSIPFVVLFAKIPKIVKRTIAIMLDSTTL